MSTELSQHFELEDSLGRLQLTVNTLIFLTPQDPDEYTEYVIEEYFRDTFIDFEIVSGPNTRPGQQQAREFQFTFTNEVGLRTWHGKTLTAVSGKLGFIFTAFSQQTLFSRYEPAVDALYDSLVLPGPELVPPSPEVVYSTLATDVSPETNVPIGEGNAFETSVSQIVSYFKYRYVPEDSEAVWLWAQVDAAGQLLETIAVSNPLPISAEGTAWHWIEPEGSLEPGFYVAVVLIDDEPMAVQPFALVLKHGEEFADPQSYVDWAQFLVNFGEHQTAVYADTQAISLDPSLAAAYERRADAYMGLCDFNSALTDISQVIELSQDQASSYQRRGYVYWRLRNTANALADLDQAIQLGSQLVTSYNLRALVHASAGHYEQALADINKALEFQETGDVPLPALLDTRGYVYLKAGQYDQARLDYEEALDQEFDVAYVLLGAGLTYHALGDSDRALEMLQRGLEQVSEVECPDPQLADLIALAEQTVEELT